MVDRLLAFIEDQRLFSSGSKLLLAVSGGIDSMVLLHLFEQLPYKISIAHCNFSLRGEESEEDEYFVKSYAQLNEIECFYKTFDIF